MGHSKTKAQQSFSRTTPGELATRLSACPEEALLLVDFDDTLWLANSTEQFIACVRPALLVSMVLQLLDLLQPWRWFTRGGHRHSRDLLRIRVVLLLFPWCRSQWQRAAHSLGPDYLNQPLCALLRSHRGPVHLVSFGFDFIIRPILDAAKLEWPLLLSSTLDNTVELRMRGKAAELRGLLGRERLAASWCLTDSLLDRDLLEACSVGLLCQWPESRPLRAGLEPMLPLVYTKKVKRPTESYISRVIFGHDYLTLLLVFALGSAQPLSVAASLFCFLLAYFSAYEIGYFENDRLGLLYEEKPKVSPEYGSLAEAFRPWFAWSCAALFALPGAWLARDLSWITSNLAPTPMESAAAVWMVFMSLLVAVRVVFAWFNRIRERGRVVPMLLLQLARTAGYLVIFSTSLVGALYCFTHSVSKWIPYVTYRFGGERKGMPLHLMNGLLLIMLLLVCWLAGGVQLAQLLQWHAWVILGYVLLRAAKDLWGFRSSLVPIRPAKSQKLPLTGETSQDESP
ncbi:hypothetical protein FCL40_13760 [Ferrimonas sediminicola]|uniref:Haloacid dehalogenase-like hydrolase n=1 Tax=Ferrimonas sediminicola TaxID=2569538 RepID=A0A4U1BBE0_9GAMM|nr:hypothetical protein [Ferrimonas sediminicola]TKB48188.1 hypothetical protein FCL40_13760 [Ferrimonas sediminicola]